MKQKLLVVALAGAFASPAMADVTISGTVNAGPYFTQSGDGATGSSNAVTALSGADALRGNQGFSLYGIASNYSNINLRSEEDLGNGLKVLFQYQFDISNTGARIDQVSSSNSMRSRNSYLGLGGGWGAVKFGTNENIYEQYLYQADPLDGAAGVGGNLQMFGSPGYGVVFDIGQSGLSPTNGSAGFYRRTDSNLWYESPDWNGFSFGASYSLNAYQTANSGVGSQKPQVLSLGGQFKPADMPFYVNLAYERHKDMFGLEVITGAGNTGSSTESTDTGVKLQGGVMFGDLTVGAIVEQLKYKAPGSASITEYKRTAWGLHAKYNLPSGYIGANFGIAQDGKIKGTATGDADKSGATYFGLGYFHNLSKQTQIQIIGSVVQNEDNAWYVLAGANTPNVAPGADHRGIYLGIKHSF